MQKDLIADLRSDTVTKPSVGMLEAIRNAVVGDDVFDEDPTVKKLEELVAGIFGKEAGLFCPSGTMTNQIGIKTLTAHGEEIICDSTSHIYLYEGGGLAFHSGLSTALLQGDRGRITAEQVQAAIRPDNVYSPRTTLVSLENTHNRGGGSIYEIGEIEKIHSVSRSNNLMMHLDGARIFNALAESGYSALEIGKYFDTISVCLSKGLGAPVGSVLVTSKGLIGKARRLRKVMGGGMRQSGFLAAAGIFAIENNIQNLKKDHERAKVLAETLAKLSFVEEVLPVQTNIVVTRLHNKMPLELFLKQLKDKGVLAVAFGPQQVRMVTHLDFNDDLLDHTCNELKKF